MVGCCLDTRSHLIHLSCFFLSETRPTAVSYTTVRTAFLQGFPLFNSDPLKELTVSDSVMTDIHCTTISLTLSFGHQQFFVSPSWTTLQVCHVHAAPIWPQSTVSTTNTTWQPHTIL